MTQEIEKVNDTVEIYQSKSLVEHTVLAGAVAPFIGFSTGTIFMLSGPFFAPLPIAVGVAAMALYGASALRWAIINKYKNFVSKANISSSQLDEASIEAPKRKENSMKELFDIMIVTGDQKSINSFARYLSTGKILKMFLFGKEYKVLDYQTSHSVIQGKSQKTITMNRHGFTLRTVDSPSIFESWSHAYNLSSQLPEGKLKKAIH